MLNRDRKEVIDALYDALFDTGMYESALKIVLNFEHKIGVKFSILNDFKDWLNSEYIKPFKITKTEKEYLEILQVALGVSEIKKRKESLILTIGRLSITRSQQVDLFPSLEEEKCFKINDILENYEVIDNETNDL